MPRLVGLPSRPSEWRHTACRCLETNASRQCTSMCCPARVATSGIGVRWRRSGMPCTSRLQALRSPVLAMFRLLSGVCEPNSASGTLRPALYRLLIECQMLIPVSRFRVMLGTDSSRTAPCTRRIGPLFELELISYGYGGRAPNQTQRRNTRSFQCPYRRCVASVFPPRVREAT